MRREPAAAARPPEFESYSVLRILGEGGMGIVYLGHDLRADLPVAIKVMSKRLTDPIQRRRFLQENEILSELNHRNIVRCFEIAETRDGVPSIVMEYLDGVDLRSFEGRPYPELIPLMIQTVMGMKYLKSRNVLHRDLSSNNILVTLDNGKRLVKILDFGVAKVLREQPREGDIRTLTGLFLGKFSFASPENFFSKDVDWRSDIYSLGVVFHRLVTGTSPIRVERANNYYEWVMAHQRPLSLAIEAPGGNPPLPEALRSVVERMLARSPDDRPQSYDEVIEVLDRMQRRVQEQGLEPDAQTLSALPLPVEGVPVEALAELPPPAPPAADNPYSTVPPPPPSALPTTERGERAALDWLKDEPVKDDADDTEKVNLRELVKPPAEEDPERALRAVPARTAPVPPPPPEPPPEPPPTRAPPQPPARRVTQPRLAEPPPVPEPSRPKPAPPVRATEASGPLGAPRALRPPTPPGGTLTSTRNLAIAVVTGIAALFGVLLWALATLMRP